MKTAAVIAGLLLAALAAPASAAPRETAIARVLANPKAFDGRTVRLRGQVNECASYTCLLCPEAMTQATFKRAQCVAIGFGLPGDDGEGTGERLREEAYRFAVITVEGRFDAACLTHKGDKPGEFVVCSDRATVMPQALVLAVHARHGSNDGIVSDYDFGPLTPAGDQSEAMIQVWKLASVEGWGGPRTPVAAFLTAPEPDHPQSGIVCVCREAQCTGRWPARFVYSLKTPGNPFDCVELERSGGHWHLTV